MSEASIYNALRQGGLNEIGACAMMGNMFKESQLNSNNVENCCTMTDEEYTEAVDKGIITAYQFQGDSFGYGLAQYTFPDRKKELLEFARTNGVSIGDEKMQCEFCINELKRDYWSLYEYLRSTENLAVATERICNEYERPDKSKADIPMRYRKALEYYNNRSTYGESTKTVNETIQSATNWMINLAEDNSHGYEWGGWGPNDYDCGHAIITAWEQAGVPVKENGASSTGNMPQAFLKCGFKDVTAEVNLVTGNHMNYGDVLINTANHAAMYLVSGKMVHARSNDGHPESGDQTGREICIANYYNYPWDCVLRYVGGESGKTNNSVVNNHSVSSNNRYYPEILKKGDKGLEVKKLQEELNEIGFSCGDADGDFGRLTVIGVTNFQRTYDLYPIDGEAGPITLKELVKQYKLKTGKTSFFDEKKESEQSFRVGEKVNFTGDKQYLGANFFFAMKATSGTAIITAVQENAKHPYHLAKGKDTSASVYGWVDRETVEKL